MLVASLLIVGLGGFAGFASARVDRPPSYFDPQHAHHLQARSAELRAPPPASQLYAPLDGDHFEHAQIHQQRQALRRRQLVQGESGQSSSNPNDKYQSLGYINNAYNLPLNVSSNPAQLVFVQLDTGSSDLWIVSSSCSSSQCQSDQVLKFDEGRSSSFQPLLVNLTSGLNLNVTSVAPSRNGTRDGDLGSSRRVPFYRKRQVPSNNDQVGQGRRVPFSIAYGDTSSARGYIATENFTISDLGVSNQLFALVNQTNVTLISQGISGVMGFGFPRGSVIARSLLRFQDQLGEATVDPLAFSILQQSNLSYPLFGLELSLQDGRITFGAVDPIVLPTPADRAEIEWHDVVPFPSGNSALPANSSYNLDAPLLGAYVSWTIPLTDAGAAGISAEPKPTYPQVGPNALALLDSGTSSIVGPPSGVAGIFRQIRSARHVGGGRYVVPCDTQERMYFSFGGRNITLLPSDYIIGPSTSQPQLCFAWPSAIDPASDGVDWVLGTPFLRAVYSVYSIGINGKEPPKIGLYPLRQPANATDPSVIFAPEPAASVEVFLSQHGTTIASILPNSLVDLPPVSTAQYAFANATATLSVGAAPTSVGAPATYVPLLTASAGLSRVAAISSSSTPLPVPSNPAGEQQSAANQLAALPLSVVGLTMALVVSAFVVVQ